MLLYRGFYMGSLFSTGSYLIYVLPALIISMIAQIKVKSTFAKYSRIPNSRRMTGAQAAQLVLERNGVTGVTIERVSGSLTDHYDPRVNVIRLSDSVYDCATVAAVGVAAHEAGHAVQHANNYLPNKIRGFLVPVSNIGSQLGWIIALVGLFLPVQFNWVLWLGIALFSLAVLFTIVTLPVEFNASARALKTIKETMLFAQEDYKGAKSVLSAAAMTYVAATFSAIMNLLRLIAIASRRER